MMDDDRYHMLDNFGRDVRFTDAQKRCIDYDGREALVIKGTAGSGKTFMVAARVKDHFSKIRESNSDVRLAVFTYNKSVTDMITNLLDNNGVDLNDKLIHVDTADSYLSQLCSIMDIIPRAKSESDGARWYGGRKQGYKHNKSGYEPIDDDDRVSIVESVMKGLSYNDPSPYYRKDPRFMADEILWMFQNGLVDADDESKYLNMSREGRCKKYSVHLGKEARRKVFKVFVAYNEALMNKRRFEWDRLYAILYRDYMGSLDRSNKFDHVYIDEAQDLTLTKMRLLKELCKGDICVAMDKNQSIYGHRWSFQRDLGFVPKVMSLKVQFRNTRQIDLLSQDLKKADDSLLDSEDIYNVETSGYDGDLPVVVHCRNENSQMEFILDTVEKLQGKETTAILCRDYRYLNAFYQRLKTRVPNVQMFKKDQGFSMFDPGVKLITFYSAKGLGFNNVIIPYFEDGVFPRSSHAVINNLRKRKEGELPDDFNIEAAIADEMEDSRRLAYVGITRAGVRLFITYVGKPSPFLSEFDPEHYLLTDESLNIITDTRIVPVGERHPPVLVDDPNRLETFEQETEEVAAPTNTVAPEDGDVLTSRLVGLELYDRRDRNGTLWVVDGPGVKQRITELESLGFRFKYTAKGSRTTGHRPAYYLE